MNDELQTWPDVIADYIDGLEEQDKKEEYINELVSIFLSKQLLLVSVGDCELKELNKLLAKVRRLSPTSKQRKKFEMYYQCMLNKGWVSDLSSEIEKITSKSDFYNIWICRSVEISRGILPATHCAKLTHSSSSGSSILERSNVRNDSFLSTSSLSAEVIDGTYLNATDSRQIKFLMLKHNGNYLFDSIINDCGDGLEYFTDNKEDLKYWLKSYKSILNETPKSDALLKQVYFPVSQDYHLLCVLKSSSIAQVIYDSHFEKTVRKSQEKFKKSKKNSKYLEGTHLQLTGISKLLTTQSQPQNATVLNGKRGGALRLLSSQPPIWKSELKPPLYQRSWFDRGIPFNAAKEDIEFLRAFLLRNESLELSTRNPDKRKWLIKWGQNITDSVLFYAQNIQNIPAGWSDVSDIKLKSEHQYFLDPFREDDTFQSAKKASDWQKVVSDDFSIWLNKKLVGKDKKFTPKLEHRKLWRLLMTDALRELEPAMNTGTTNNNEVNV